MRQTALRLTVDPPLMSLADAEGIATALLDELGLEAPIDPWQIALALGVDVVDGPPGERPRLEVAAGRWTVVLDPTERPERRASGLAHELGHLLAERADLGRGETVAWWIAAALLLPRETMRRLVRIHGRDVVAIAAASPWTSHELVGRRLVMMDRALRLWVWDREGPAPRRYAVEGPGWRWPRPAAPLPVELEALEEAYACGGPVEPIGGVCAWRVDDAPWVRLLCLSDGEAIGGA